MNLFEYLIPFAVALGLLIVVHELGHYLVARACGVKVLRFSLGFGRPLATWRLGRDRTEWSLAAFPLGGYVKMLDEREAPVDPVEMHRAFNRQSVGKRIAIVAAGPLANLLLAVVFYWGLHVGGIEELRPRLGAPAEGSLAAVSGFVDGDLVRSVNGKPVRTWPEFRWALLGPALDREEVTVETISPASRIALHRLDFSAQAAGEDDQDLLQQIGLRPWRPMLPAEIGRISAGSPAERAGLRPGDRIVAVDGRAVGEWADVVRAVREAPGRRLRIQGERGGVQFSVEVVPEAAEEGSERFGRIGVAVADSPALRNEMFVTVRYGVLEGLRLALAQTWDTATLSVAMIGRMVGGSLSWKNISGPVTIADFAGQSARLGIIPYIKFLALISISLGVLNLLPIPVLDGGHLLYYLIEMVKGSPLPDKFMEIGQQIGIALLTLLMAFALYNDINRLVSG
ncbi:MAG: RIP metalloprotease RseP [Zoogloea sp.]|nr:RIP metalloprotease RseP [Zoogloea sp.]